MRMPGEETPAPSPLTPSPAPGERCALCWGGGSPGWPWPLMGLPRSHLCSAMGHGLSDGPDLRCLGPAALQGGPCASPDLKGQPGLVREGPAGPGEQ